MASPSYTGHRQRLKEKYKKSGITGWLDYEILELVLSYAIPRKDTKKAAKDLIEKFGTVSGVLDADIKELNDINGISEHSSVFLKLLKDMAILYASTPTLNKDLLSSPSAVYNYLRTSLKGRHDEDFVGLFLNSKNELIAAETLHTGTVNTAHIYPRKIVERALYHHAVSVIIAHNHPAGTLEASREDVIATKAAMDALNTVDIKLLDHIIIGGNGYFSFNDRNML